MNAGMVRVALRHTFKSIFQTIKQEGEMSFLRDGDVVILNSTKENQIKFCTESCIKNASDPCFLPGL